MKAAASVAIAWAVLEWERKLLRESSYTLKAAHFSAQGHSSITHLFNMPDKFKTFCSYSSFQVCNERRGLVLNFVVLSTQANSKDAQSVVHTPVASVSAPSSCKINYTQPVSVTGLVSWDQEGRGNITGDNLAASGCVFMEFSPTWLPYILMCAYCLHT